jgi:CRISPR system Cascade subunit CasE
MTLTLLSLNTDSAAVRRDLSDVQELHRTIQNSVGSDRSNSGCLWQVLTESAAVLVRTAESQSWNHLPQGYLRKPPSTVDEPPFVNGLVYDLVGMVNPTRSKFVRGQRGKRQFINSKADRRKWLETRLAGACELVDYDEGGTVSLKGNRRGSTLVVVGVQVRARVRVIDADLLSSLMVEGVGRAKAYGCGMLVARGSEVAA